MPELPEVETVVRTLTPQVRLATFRSATVLLPKTLAFGRENLTSLLPGLVLSRIWRRGKVLLMDCAPGPEAEVALILAFHLKMTGRLFVYGADEKPNSHTRLYFDLTRPSGERIRLFFDDARTFGYCRAMRPQDLAHWDFWQKLGPEPLTISPTEFASRFHGRKARIKALLLDQTRIAGVGNIYADEACFKAGICPDRTATDISDPKLKSLGTSLKGVLEHSIKECGSSIRDYRDANGDSGAFQNCFAVYGRAGKPCVTCGRPLSKGTVAGRTTVWCDHCQK